jgi:hypothetical protein
MNFKPVFRGEQWLVRWRYLAQASDASRASNLHVLLYCDGIEPATS